MDIKDRYDEIMRTRNAARRNEAVFEATEAQLKQLQAECAAIGHVQEESTETHPDTDHCVNCRALL